MSYREYATHRGCTLRAVQKAVGERGLDGKRSGRIADALVPVEGSVYPRIDSAKADALWLLNTDEAKRSTLFTPNDGTYVDLDAENPASASEPEDDGPTGDPEIDATKKTYHQARARRESINVEEAELDLAIRKGQLIDLEGAKQLGFTVLRSLRDALRNIGARIGSQVAAMDDPFLVEQLINGEIDAVLSSVTVETLLAEQIDEDDADGQGD